MKKVTIKNVVYQFFTKVKVDNDQEMAQSERNSHSKNRGGEILD